MSNYKDLEVWKKSHKFALEIYKITDTFPKEEKYGIVSQLRRGSLSIPTNIVEGKGSTSTRKLSNFLDISRGSAQEVEYLLLFSKDLGYIDQEKYNILEKECISIL